MKPHTLLLLAAAVSSATLASAQEVTLDFRPTKGEKLMYSLAFDIAGLGQSMVFKAKVTNEIVETMEDGSYMVATSQTDQVVLVEGAEQSVAAANTTSVATYDKSGKPLKIAGDEAGPESFRVANLTSFITPGKALKVGDEWDVEIAGDAGAKTESVKQHYKLVRIEQYEGGERAVVEFSAAETSGENRASAKGTLTVDTKTGRQLTYVADVTDIPIGVQVVSGKIELKLSGS